jgi:hypothetical protein
VRRTRAEFEAVETLKEALEGMDLFGDDAETIVDEIVERHRNTI